MYFNQRSDISTLNDSSLKLLDKFTFLGSSIPSTKIDINTRLAKAWTANDRLSVIWKSDRTDIYWTKLFLSSGRIDTAIWMHYTDVWKKCLTAITQECCEQYWTSPGSSTPPSSSCTVTYYPPRKLFKLDEPDMWDTAGEVKTTPSHGREKTGRQARTYIHQLCVDTGCGLEDLPGAMDDRDGWWERVREIRANGTTWWWPLWRDIVVFYSRYFFGGGSYPSTEM